jgi:N-acyl-D-glutamate deacylase
MPATVLEQSVPAGRRKGRLQEGAGADIVVFDPQTISDRSTYDKPNEPSVSVKYLIVNGHPATKNGEIIPNVHFGRALSRKNSRF